MSATLAVNAAAIRMFRTVFCPLLLFKSEAAESAHAKLTANLRK